MSKTEETKFRLISGAGAEMIVHAESAEAKGLSAAITAEHLAMLNTRPLMNHSCRVVLPSGRQIWGLRAKRWLADNL